MEFHAPLMTFINHPLQRIPIRHRCFSLYSCQKMTPWLYAAFVECITCWTNLKYNGVGTIFLQFIQLVGKCFLHLLRTHALKLSVDTLNPCPTEFTFYRLCRQS